MELQIFGTFNPRKYSLIDLKLKKTVERDMDSQKYQYTYKDRYIGRFFNGLLISDKPFRSFLFLFEKAQVSMAFIAFY